MSYEAASALAGIICDSIVALSVAFVCVLSAAIPLAILAGTIAGLADAAKRNGGG